MCPLCRLGLSVEGLLGVVFQNFRAAVLPFLRLRVFLWFVVCLLRKICSGFHVVVVYLAGGCLRYFFFHCLMHVRQCFARNPVFLLGRQIVFISSNGCPCTQCVFLLCLLLPCRTEYLMLCECVPISRWLGLTHSGLLHLWQT